MNEPVDRPDYWRERISRCKGELHRVMFEGSLSLVSRMEYEDRLVLEKAVTPDTSILDCGCGYGRLLYLLPGWWRGSYVGVDISPEFLNLARTFHPGRTFLQMDLRDLRGLDDQGVTYDLGVVSWVKNMIEVHLGAQVWRKMELEIRKRTKDVLFLREPE